MDGRWSYWYTISSPNTNDPQKKYRLGTVSKTILMEGLNRFHSANLTLSSDIDKPLQIMIAVLFVLKRYNHVKCTTAVLCVLKGYSHIK